MFLNAFKNKGITLRGVCFLLKYKIYMLNTRILMLMQSAVDYSAFLF